MLRPGGGFALPTIEDSASESASYQSESSFDQNGDSIVDREGLASKENKAICWLRVFVILVMLLAAVLVAIVVYILTSNSEENDFTMQFDADVTQLMDRLDDQVYQKLGALESLAVSITSYATGRNSSWPMVTATDFEQRASTTKFVGDALSVGLVPLVTWDERRRWEAYALLNNGWISEGLAFEEDNRDTGRIRRSRRRLEDDNQPGNYTGYADAIFMMDEGDAGTIFGPVVDDSPGPYLPIWQHYPIRKGLINYNLLSNVNISDSLNTALDTQQAILTIVAEIAPEDPLSRVKEPGATSQGGGSAPLSIMTFPVFNNFENDKELVAVLYMLSYSSNFFDHALAEHSSGTIIVIESGCSQNYTFLVKKGIPEYLGLGDLHDELFDDFKYQEPLTVTRKGVQLNTESCPQTFHIYPTLAMRSEYISSLPGIYTLGVVFVFIFALATFITYDCIVERRQKIVFKTAVENRAIVASLFPSAIRERLFNSDWDEEKKQLENLALGVAPLGVTAPKIEMPDASSDLHVESSQNRLQKFLKEGPDSGNNQDPIADLFPNTTVLFADIAGFTAWSSQREPAQVFTLLQTLYQSFDRIAKKLGVFKIETIGDCYVAVTGLPEPQADHAVRMARFARECIYKMQDLVKQLEVSLGPDTGDLCLRVGIHSGPVTAGVLRGEKSRFQLFGDTVNTAARMESTGQRNCIQCSTATADLLKGGGKQQWLRPRLELVVAKGKGEMQTYWVATRSSLPMGDSEHSEGMRRPQNVQTAPSHESVRSFRTLDEDASVSKTWFGKMVADSQVSSPAEKKQRLIDWNVELLGRVLKKIQARRNITATEEASSELPTWEGSAKLVFEEVVEQISFPKVDPYVASIKTDPDLIDLGEEVMNQLRDFVSKIAGMYNDNPFHNFEHASHVTMATNKLFNRFVNLHSQRGTGKDDPMTQYTSKICYHPLVHFAVILSAVIHDIDHFGVSNYDLIRENSEVAEAYDNTSPAEQHSVDVAWELLMDSSYEELHKCICRDQAEFELLRQIVVNLVMATDIFDLKAKEFREKRWRRAFETSEEDVSDESIHDLRATVMLEHTIQAADVGHTMQHWHVYRKWNEKLFNEMMSAYEKGRSMKNPSEGWYTGELAFFDRYIIPLSKKLSVSGAFGVGGKEYINYATENRLEWAAKGKGIVAEMVGKRQGSAPVLPEKQENMEGRKYNGDRGHRSIDVARTRSSM